VKNSEIAKVFQDVADLLELKGENQFKIRAYQRVVRSIEHLPVAVDMEAIFRVAAETNTVLEINGMPSRLDLKDIHVYRARELGVKLVINTDAHSTEHLEFMRFGMGVARRGWCQAQDILNTRALEEVIVYLRR